MTVTTRRDLFRTLLRPTEAAQAQANPFVGEPVTQDPIVHFLNRISWGPRPEEVAEARTIGLEATLEAQLAPESLADTEAEARMAKLPILSLERRELHSLRNAEWRTREALLKGMVTRAVHSRHQLLERMVEFWSDHFNIPLDEYILEFAAFQKEVIRPHALGSFRDMLVATAKSPAMLHYLDNFVNFAEEPNENYARELLELHTMGVDGGYTETDVKEVARAFTGWTVRKKTRTGFYFEPYNHDMDEKVVLGKRLAADRGIEDGLQVLEMLANHPATARFLSTKLCQRFVSDTPPASLVDKVTAVWQQTGGDIKSVLRALFLSPEFMQSSGQKMKRPLDFLIGALRATGTEVYEWWQLEEMLYTLGQPPYGWHPPNGYPDAAGAWTSTGGLLMRWNIAMQLTHGAYSDSDELGYGLTTAIRQRIGDPQTVGDLVDAVATQIFGAPLIDKNRAAFIAYAADGDPEAKPVTLQLLGRKLGSLFGLMLASPIYQWR
ncbi:MAG: DUF1800 domain-containing protein [Chloroflexota bacterium]